MSDTQARNRVAGLFAGTATTDSAQQLLVARCMEQKGQSYQPILTTRDKQVPREYSDDVETARTDGYGLQDEVTAARRSLAQEQSGAQGQPQRLALFGPEDRVAKVQIGSFVVEAPTEGCVAEAQTALYGSVAEAVTHDELTVNVLRLYLDRASQQPAVTASLDKWRTCMKDRSYDDLESRNSARGQALAKYDELAAAKAAVQERAIAVDDAECDREANYTRTRAAADNDALRAFLNENEGLVQGALEGQADALKQSREALG